MLHVSLLYFVCEDQGADTWKHQRLGHKVFIPFFLAVVIFITNDSLKFRPYIVLI